MAPGFLALALLVSPPASAKPVELRWDAPAACPDEAALRGQVEAILGAPLAAPRPRPLSVIAVVRDDRGTRSLRIFTVTAEGMRERALRYDRDCALLTRAAAVLIAITIDPTSVGRLDPEALALLDPPSEPAVTPAEPTREAPTSEVPTSEVPTSEVPTSEVPTREAPTSEAPKDLRVKPDETPAQAQAADPVAPSLRVWRPRAGLRALGGLGLGDLPGAGGGASVAAALVFRHLRIELVASLWPGRRARIVGTEAGADFLLWTLGPRVCGVVHAHRLLEVPLCAGLEAGRVRVAGVRLHNNPSDRVTWMAAVLAPSLVVAPWRRLALWISPELVVPATRTSFLVEDIGAIHRAKAAAGRFMVGVELRVP